jgi:D-alanine--poly(phosphoribitol) ligase subunit 1
MGAICMRFDLEWGFVDLDVGIDKIALVTSDGSLTWGEFKDRVENWICQYRCNVVAGSSPVVIIGHKEINYVVAIAGCLLLKIPYVPVDSKLYPVERIAYVKEAVGAGCVYDANINCFDVASNSKVAENYESVAYILFTSGSTGFPKGVMISRNSLIELSEWMIKDFNLPHDAVFMNQAPFTFDLSVYELIAFLTTGGSCVLNDSAILSDINKFLTLQKTSGVSVWVSTPSFVQKFLLYKNFNYETLDKLGLFLFCGEVLPPTLVKELMLRFPNTKILNTYGPTEATVATSYVFIDEAVLAKYPVLPAGFPKRDVSICIEEGEIIIVGGNVMLGYLNRPDLNGQKLILRDGVRGFKTGDLGEIRDGMLFCHGRMDQQIKLNGYRIELEEIEQVLSASNSVLGCSIVPIKDADGAVLRLVAFVILADGCHHLVKKDLRLLLDAELLTKLPPYMRPSEYFVVDSFPLSANSKIDKKALLNLYET